MQICLIINDPLEANLSIANIQQKFEMFYIHINKEGTVMLVQISKKKVSLPIITVQSSFKTEKERAIEINKT